MKDLKACFTQHSLTHYVFGIGIGLLLAGVVTGLAGQTGVVLGIILIVGALAYDNFLVK